ncbi:MAG: thioredoxin family protein [Synechococcus sp.]
MHLQDSAFKSVVLTKPYTLISFGASWCRLCDLLQPALNRVVAEWNETVDLLTVDVDLDWRLARQYRIRSLPTLLLVGQDGTVVQRINHFRNREDMLRQCEVLVQAHLLQT